MPKLRAILENIASGVGVYFATFIGILLSQYAPLLLTHGQLDFVFDTVRTVISGVVAFYIVMNDEAGGDLEGKRKNLRKRIGAAFAHGVTWSTLIGIGGMTGK